MSKTSRLPRKLTEQEVLGFIAQFATQAPEALTLSDAVKMFVEQFAEMSDKLSIKQASDLMSLFGIVTKYAAAQHHAANTQIIIPKETAQ